MTQRFSAVHRLAAALAVCGAVTTIAADDLPTTSKSPPQTASENGNETRSPRCTVRNESKQWWLIDPGGKPFFSLGICMLNQGSDRGRYDRARPSYAAWRHYESPEAWAASSLQRLKSWGFTTAGGWSDYEVLRTAGDDDLWITPVLNLGARSGAPWFDMWDPKVIRRIEELAEETIPPFRNDPRVIGYYSDNEIGWWNAILWKMTLEQPPTSGQRQRLIRLTREVYTDDWKALVKDFEPENAASWDELDRGGKLWLRPGGTGMRTMRRFLALVAERYYQLMRESIDKFDLGRLYLGDRYQSFFYPELALATRQHVDVVSTNLNAGWNDGTFLESYLDTLHELTGKPLVVSEFYMSAAENSSGNKNKVGGFPIVATQKERGEAAANTLRALARLPYVVGVDWFQYYDEPPHGRELDGEDFNFGLVDVHDRPYAEVTSAFSSLDLMGLKSAARPRRPGAADGVPPAPARPLADFRHMTALKSWDRTRGRIPATSRHPTGELYVCWSPSALYLATYVVDIVEPDYYKSGEVPEIDRARWTVELNGGAPITARVGAGKDPAISCKDVRFESYSGSNHDVRCITAIEVPAAKLGKDRFGPGERLSLKSTFDTLGRASRIEWSGEFVLAK